MPLTADELVEIQKLLWNRIEDAPPNAPMIDESRLIARLEEVRLELLGIPYVGKKPPEERR